MSPYGRYRIRRRNVSNRQGWAIAGEHGERVGESIPPDARALRILLEEARFIYWLDVRDLAPRLRGLRELRSLPDLVQSPLEGQLVQTLHRQAHED